MNLREAIQNLTDEELGELLDLIVNRQLEKAKKKEPDHYYEFTGTWSYGVWAPNKEEAIECFKDSCPDEFDLCTDEYKVEQYE